MAPKLSQSCALVGSEKEYLVPIVSLLNPIAFQHDEMILLKFIGQSKEYLMSGPEKTWQKNLPMALTYARAAAGPLILAILMSGWTWAGWASAILFVLASLTDWFDGYFARKFGVESNMGRFMDPIADKILVLGAIIMLLTMNRVDPVMVFLFLARDIFIGGIRAVAASSNMIISAKPFGKWKTAFQMSAIPCLLIYDPIFSIPIADIGYLGLWVSVLLSLISGVEYTWGYYKNVAKSGGA